MKLVNKPLPCIICNKVLDNVMPDDIPSINQPYGGTVFSTRGHYGSTVYDPLNENQYLEITVCDECLKNAGEQKRVIEIFVSPKPAEKRVVLWGFDESRGRSK